VADDGFRLVELLQKSEESDFLRAVAEALLQVLIEAAVEGLIGRHSVIVIESWWLSGEGFQLHHSVPSW
jgi:hypothetical protein